MPTQTRKTTVTFVRPFQLDKLKTVLPAGVYSVESENDVLDGMFLPDCLLPSVFIRLHATPDSPGHAQTLTVPWAVLEAALLRDRSPATVTLPEPRRDADRPHGPTAHALDSVSEAHVRDLVSHLPKRKPFHAKSGR